MESKLSLAASLLLLQEKFIDVVVQLWKYISSISCFSKDIIMTINECSYEGSNNSLYKAAATYIDGHVLPNSACPRLLTVDKLEKVKDLMFGLDSESEIVEKFNGKAMKWKYKILVDSNDVKREKRWFELKFHRKHADAVKKEYLPHVLDKAKELMDKNHVVSFHTVQNKWWRRNSGNLTHPMTFEKLCLDRDLKEKLLEDIQSFMAGKDYYNEIGKVWKRGYLLYGPPGTGKSSLIAAMANKLNYDIYNLNLSAVDSDSTLENLLLYLPSRSILVVEDIDCSIKLQNRESEKESDRTVGYNKVALATLLNALDGLLSCCGDERITVITTNYKDELDPALLRPGRMDMHIELSYCTFSTFTQLAAKYLKNVLVDEKFAPDIAKLLRKVEVSPADVAGELMKLKNSATPLEDFIEFLKKKVDSEKQSSVSPPSTSKVDEKVTEEENDNESQPE